jgi:hypothetical protein
MGSRCTAQHLHRTVNFVKAESGQAALIPSLGSLLSVQTRCQYEQPKNSVTGEQLTSMENRQLPQ